MGIPAPPRVYLDYNATAPVRPEVREAIEPILFGAVDDGGFGNPSSVHWAGQTARRYLERARTQFAQIVHRKPSEIIFTSGGTEANNLAILGVLFHPARRNGQLIISEVEHPSVVAAAQRAAEQGVKVTRIPVDESGALEMEALARGLEAPTALVAIMAANNETGVVYPSHEIAQLVHQAGALLFVDAVQAAGRIPLPQEADLFSVSGHKLGALKGIGALVSKSNVPLQPTLVGGPQERDHRAGTESVAGAVALACALARSVETQAAETERLRQLRDRIEASISTLEGTQIIGSKVPRLSNTSAIVFSGVEGDALLQLLDLEGVAASSGSACSSGSLEPSRVLRAMGLPNDLALGAVRFSLGWDTRPAHIDRLLALLPSVLAQARA